MHTDDFQAQVISVEHSSPSPFPLTAAAGGVWAAFEDNHKSTREAYATISRALQVAAKAGVCLEGRPHTPRTEFASVLWR